MDNMGNTNKNLKIETFRIIVGILLIITLMGKLFNYYETLNAFITDYNISTILFHFILPLLNIIAALILTVYVFIVYGKFDNRLLSISFILISIFSAIIAVADIIQFVNFSVILSDNIYILSEAILYAILCAAYIIMAVNFSNLANKKMLILCAYIILIASAVHFILPYLIFNYKLQFGSFINLFYIISLYIVFPTAIFLFIIGCPGTYRITDNKEQYEHNNT